jgi:hypothetical protein
MTLPKVGGGICKVGVCALIVAGTAAAAVADAWAITVAEGAGFPQEAKAIAPRKTMDICHKRGRRGIFFNTQFSFSGRCEFHFNPFLVDTFITVIMGQFHTRRISD